MTILGQFYKQPIEVEYYGIQFAQDMQETDHIQASFTILSRQSAPIWDQVKMSSVYTPVAADNDRVIVTTADVLAPTGLSDGFRLNVSNASQTNMISIGTINLPARGAIVVVAKSGVWVEEAKTNSILVSLPQDQRIRTRFFGGTLYESYEVQVAIDTSEGRTLQDEFIVNIEET